MHIKNAILVLAVIAMLLTACSNSRGRSESISIDEVTSTESFSSSIQQTSNVSLFQELFEASPQDLDCFFYLEDTPIIYHSYKPYPEYTDNAFCIIRKFYEEEYVDEEAVFIDTFATMLDNFTLNQGTREEVKLENWVPDTAEHMSFALSFNENPSPISLFIFKNGDVFYFCDYPQRDFRYYKASDHSQYAVLKDSLTQLRADVDALPLDYHFYASVAFPDIRTGATQVVLYIVNNGAKPVFFSHNFVVEKLENDVWQSLEEIDPMVVSQETGVVEPREYLEFIVTLTNIKGGQDEGKYRITNSFYTDTESLPYTIEYEISDVPLIERQSAFTP